ncbi:hypothetical protein MNBD_GAMMA23-327 [hydrothermal vent metagenome]|uniref:Coenzyme F390 synthetase n=1 Tax=hydrothermal vent metagenome TaxID=652676 RepID=A0A3B1AJA0_9ZZZZ
MFQSLYNLSPVFIQNILVSVYGLKLKRLRYSGIYAGTLKKLLASQKLEKDKIYALQNKKLTELVEYAYKNIPYYQDILCKKNITPNEVNINNFAQHFPVLHKETIRTHPESFVSQDHSLGKVVQINTSGTSGSPLNVVTSRSTIQENYAFFSRYLMNCGIKSGEASVTFAGRIIIPNSQKNGPYWRRNYSMNNTLFSSYNISEETIPSYIEEIDRIQPTFIDSYPSAIFEIAHFIVKNKIKHNINPVAIVTSSETLLDSQRLIIEEAFNTKIYDHYGNAEMAALVTQCSEGSYHINSDFGIIEILDHNGHPVDNGEIGHIVCTGFINKRMPLIRYSIGDSAKLSTKICGCGCHFPVIDSIEGRTDDLLTLKDGRKIGRLDPVFKGLSSIKETQIIQESLDLIRVKIVKESDYNNAQTDVLITELKKRLGNDIAIEINFVNEIKRTKSGKFKSVVSRI